MTRKGDKNWPYVSITDLDKLASIYPDKNLGSLLVRNPDEIDSCGFYGTCLGMAPENGELDCVDAMNAIETDFRSGRCNCGKYSEVEGNPENEE